MTLQATHPGEVTLGPEAPAPGGAPTPPAATPVPGLVRLPVGEVGRRPRRWSVALRLLLPVSVFAAWWILTATGVIPSTTLSTPPATWHAFVQLWNHDDLLGDIGVSARRAALGLALGAGVGLILGIVVGLTRLGEELFDASMQMLRMVPYPAVIFLFIIWFGIGETAKVLLIGLATLFPMYLNTSNGVRNVDKRVVEAARSFGVQGWALVRRVVVPAGHAVHHDGTALLRGHLRHRPRLHRKHRRQPRHRLSGQPGRQPPADPRSRGVRRHLRVARHRGRPLGPPPRARQHAVETAPGGPMNPSPPSEPTWPPSSTV